MNWVRSTACKVLYPLKKITSKIQLKISRYTKKQENVTHTVKKKINPPKWCLSDLWDGIKWFYISVATYSKRGKKERDRKKFMKKQRLEIFQIWSYNWKTMINLKYDKNKEKSQ